MSLRHSEIHFRGWERCNNFSHFGHSALACVINERGFLYVVNPAYTIPCSSEQGEVSWPLLLPLRASLHAVGGAAEAVRHHRVSN